MLGSSFIGSVGSAEVLDILKYMLLTVGACWTRFRAGAYSFGSL